MPSTFTRPLSGVYAQPLLGCIEQTQHPFATYHKTTFYTRACKALHTPIFPFTMRYWPIANGSSRLIVTKPRRRTSKARIQAGPDPERAIRDYVRAYVWRHGRRKTAEVLGAEYGWGTLRTTLTGSPGRWQLLASKLLTLMLLSGVGLVIVALLAAISNFIAASLISANGGGLTDSGAWSTVAVIFGKGVYGLVPYIILALFLSVLTSSSSMGISIGLGYYFVEAILVGILTNVFDWFSNATDFLLGPSVIAWMTEPGVQATGGDAALFPLQDLPSQLHAFLVLTAYIVIIGTVAFWLFQHKDIAGAKGE